MRRLEERKPASAARVHHSSPRRRQTPSPSGFPLAASAALCRPLAAVSFFPTAMVVRKAAGRSSANNHPPPLACHQSPRSAPRVLQGELLP
ncbi:hypothetical protein SKAU_G00088900 [Synaphobranchus kaupii]|uniref:Uncharacterized protein n=1 Tax=Synaphobranchus kaupii TaxID=118154 RepID=A0A9Q1FWG1_SYNKA|nr:hypothetical protein SKAU_G00088900 [Synaphobranchus kaupii]